MPLTQVRLGNHTVLVETSADAAAGYVPASRGARIADDLQSAAGSLAETILGVVEEVDAAIRQVAPREAEVEIGIKFTGEGSVFLAKVGAEANLKVTLKWGARESN